MFDVAATKSQLLSEVGFEWELSSDFERARSKRSLTGWGSGFLHRAIECLLVGFDEPAYKLLEKALVWLLAAMDEKEVPRGLTLNGAETFRLEDIAICRWLLSGQHDAESLQSAVKRREVDMTSEGRHKQSLELTLVVYLDAGRCERAIELFDTTRGFSPPKSPAQVRTQARMVYVLCKHRCRGEYTDGDIRKCLASFLRKQVDECLKGPYTTLARWMKIAHWDGIASRESARAALLHCFNYVEVVGTREAPV